jgi:hypothetical protein
MCHASIDTHARCTLRQEYHGHSGGVGGVRYSWDGRYVVTVGAQDR